MNRFEVVNQGRIVRVDWAHSMVNLVLGDDWHDEIFVSNYIPPEKPLSIPEINMKLKERGFRFR